MTREDLLTYINGKIEQYTGQQNVAQRAGNWKGAAAYGMTLCEFLLLRDEVAKLPEEVAA